MSITINRLYFIWNYQEEENWLNRMAKKGLNLVVPGLFRYTFAEETPGEYEYRIQRLPHFPSHKDSQEYIRFVEDTGAEYIGSIKEWVYFRKKTSEGPFELISDLPAKLHHFRGINLITWLCLVCILAIQALMVLPTTLEGIVPYPRCAFVTMDDVDFIITAQEPDNYPEIKFPYGKEDVGTIIPQSAFQQIDDLYFQGPWHNVTITQLNDSNQYRFGQGYQNDMYSDYSPFVAIKQDTGYLLNQNSTYVKACIRGHLHLLPSLVLSLPLVILLIYGVIRGSKEIRFLKRELRIRE